MKEKENNNDKSLTLPRLSTCTRIPNRIFCQRQRVGWLKLKYSIFTQILFKHKGERSIIIKYQLKEKFPGSIKCIPKKKKKMRGKKYFVFSEFIEFFL